MNLGNVHVFFFDLDGVLSVGKEKPRYLGGREVIVKIKAQGKKAFVLTNDSTHIRREIHENLTKMGFNFNQDEILTSSYLTAMHLHDKFGNASFFLVGAIGTKCQQRNDAWRLG